MEEPMSEKMKEKMADIPSPEMKSKREKYKYYYKKPGSKKEDPSVILSTVATPSGGEIIIGTDDDAPIDQMIVLLVRSTLDKAFINSVKAFKKYFGETNYEPVRQEIIRLNKMYLRKLTDEGIKMPMPVVKIVFSENWSF